MISPYINFHMPNDKVTDRSPTNLEEMTTPRATTSSFLQSPLSYVYQPKVLDASGICHVITATKIPVNKTPTRLKGNIEKWAGEGKHNSPSQMWRGSTNGNLSIGTAWIKMVIRLSKRKVQYIKVVIKSLYWSKSAVAQSKYLIRYEL
jgi:hypothetical protein